jgi:hypothetical protein
MEISLGKSEVQAPGRNIDWMPLLIVIGAVYLISSAIVYGSVSYGSYYGGDYELEFQINLVLGFVASTIFIVAIASVVYSRIEQAKKLLIVGMLIVILNFAVRTEVYLRATL